MDNVILSPFESIEIPTKPLIEYIVGSLTRYSDNKSLICCFTDRSYTFREVDEKSLHLARNCVDEKLYGLKTGDLVSLILPNVPEYGIVLVACLRAGLTVAPVPAIFDKNEIAHQLQFLNPKLVFTTEKIAGYFKNDPTNRFVSVYNESKLTICQEFSKLCESSNEKMQQLQCSRTDDVIFMVPTSGTTGLSKRVQITQQNILASFAQLQVFETQDYFEERKTKQFRYLVMTAMCYNFGITNILVQLIMGYTLLCMPEFSISDYVKSIAKYKPTVLQMLPIAFHHFNMDKAIKAELMESVKLIITSGTAVGPLALKRFSDKFPDIKVTVGYSMTETCGPNMSRAIKVRSPDSVGVLLPNTEARIVSLENNSGRVNLGPNRHGELYLKGPQVMKGYFQNESATADVLVEDGWLRTGDVAYYDDNQEFFVTNRVSDYIKVDGKLVSPIELEDILRGHPCVKDVAVVAVENKIYGQVPKAYIVLNVGYDYYDPYLLQKYLESKLWKEEHKKLLGGISVLEFIPKTPGGGKVNKILLRQMSHQTFDCLK